MADTEYSRHARDVMSERKIPEDWVQRALDQPDRVEIAPDSTSHHIKAIPEHGGRYLRVVVNPSVTPHRVVTVFFDRRLGRQL